MAMVGTINLVVPPGKDVKYMFYAGLADNQCLLVYFISPIPKEPDDNGRSIACRSIAASCCRTRLQGCSARKFWNGELVISETTDASVLASNARIICRLAKLIASGPSLGIAMTTL